VADHDDARPPIAASGTHTVVNRGLAVSTIIGALLVEAYAMMQLMGTAGCPRWHGHC
jgi:hypothetical protein